MGRHAVRGDLKRRPITFSLGAREMAFVRWYEEAYEMSKSQAVRAIFERAESTLNGSERREVSMRRVALTNEARRRPVAAAPAVLTRCPACGESDLFVPLRGDKWRCDACLASR